jgi:galactose mutarotase-like enzyme
VRADSGTGLPMHGTLPRPWRVLEPGAAELDGASEAFPFPHTIRMQVELADALRFTTTIEAHDGLVPVSFGFHPFLTIPGVPRTEWHVEIPVTRHRAFPSGETQAVEPHIGPLGDRAYDDGYDERDDRPFVVAAGGRRITVDFERGFPFAQVYAPPAQDLICFEPMTAPTDALRAGTFPVAEAGKPFVTVFSIAVD